MPIFHDYKMETVFKIFLDQLHKATIYQLLMKSLLNFVN